ncbi:LysE family translocator [Microlunatus sp. Gsoil 973]|uniref:LysE family translocator n=1 Tax=Microlunatus sp. Gsoil 973 TaxID=2672569 RepID=UPI0012B45F65|nr:LysE family translocator [Microlunatus sp. Gsoil 973]QGN33536.1 LysE family translocator [Microlunatus sp. Gsoil 973]
MPSTAHLLAFGLTSLILVVIPGPSVLFTISRAMTVGRRAALLTVIGNALGCYLQVTAVAFGVGALVSVSVVAFMIMKYLGAGYIVFLGVQAVRHRRSLLEAVTRATSRPRSTVRVVLDGLVVGVTNPKTIVLFAAALPQFTDPAGPAPTVQMLVLGALFPLIAVVCDSVWAVTASRARDWFARSPRRMEAVGGVGGLTMMGVGIGVALTGRKD